MSLAAHRHRIVVIHLSSLPSHRRRPIVVVVLDDINVDVVVVVVVVIVTAVVFHLPIVVVAIAAIIVVGIVVFTVALSCSLAVNPRNSTKASQGGIAHGMGMERLPLDLP